MLLNKFLALLINYLRRVELKLHFYLLRGENKFLDIDQAKRIKDSTKYNMATESNEIFYLEEYFDQIRDFLPQKNSVNRIVDLGCGQGRFLQRIIDMYPDTSIMGIDVSEDALRFASESIGDNANVELACGNYNELLSEQKNYSDIIFYTEVAFYNPNWKQDFDLIIENIAPGGLFIGSFRSTYFNVLDCITNSNLIAAETVLNSNIGRLSYSSSTVFAWNSSWELIDLIESKGLTVLRCAGIGVCSGIHGDPLSRICIPSELSKPDQEILRKIENKLARLLPDVGRYILIVAQKLNE
jgi:2-polyprenyl-3-methyl-5-hydroxy-6-metoxy-1,4-benzoquinol methylase